MTVYKDSLCRFIDEKATSKFGSSALNTSGNVAVITVWEMLSLSSHLQVVVFFSPYTLAI